MNTTAYPDLRIFNLDQPPSDTVMDQIYHWCDPQSVYAHWAAGADDRQKYFRIVFHKWQSIKPEHQTWLELMLT